MKIAEVSSPNGATGRADLLRALACARSTASGESSAPWATLTLDADDASWFGYVRTETQEPPVKVPGGGVAFPPQPPTPATSAPPRLQMSFVHLLVERTSRRKEKASPAAPDRERAEQEPIEEEEAKAPSDCLLVGYEDLVPKARLLPALRRSLAATRAGAIDLDRLIDRIAARKLPRHLPRQSRPCWHPDLVVVLDFCSRLWPYREDMHRLAERLLGQCGRAGVSLRIVNHGPLAGWRDWVAEQNPRAGVLPVDREWTPLTAGTPVLIASDLGLLLGAQSPVARAWQEFVARLFAAQALPLALVPLGAEQVDAKLTPRLPIVRWSPDSRLRCETAHGSGKPEANASTDPAAPTAPAGLDDLLAMVSVLRRVDPPLLRALRRINPRAPRNAGLEGALWCHRDVEAGTVAVLRKDQQEAHQQRFSEHLRDWHAPVDALRRLHHAHLRAVLNHEELLLWHSRIGADEVTAELAERLVEAEGFFKKLAYTVREDKTNSAWVWRSVAQKIVDRADAGFVERHRPLLTPLVVALARSPGGIRKAPDWIDPAELATHLGDEQPLPAWIVRDAASASLLLQAEHAGARQTAVGEALTIDAGGLVVRFGNGSGERRRWYSQRDLPLVLAALDDPLELRLDTSSETLTLAAVMRPRGVREWSCRRSGIFVRSQALGGVAGEWDRGGKKKLVLSGAMTLSGEAVLGGEREALAPALRAVRVEAGGWRLEADSFQALLGDTALKFGIDAQFGVYAEFTVTTRHGSASQRLRWIEPGTFLMGSPEDEPRRDNDEGPRHEVTISCGFWLADTACTQQLWQVVTGTNPSRFRDDPQNPVEQVSWNDVQKFLRALEKLLPGCRADLPTEAEWEYACRAGTTTAFSFGDRIDPQRANYDGNVPHADGEKGLCRGRTVPVKSFPPNPCGLYEMHGNVYEWCADGLRTYDGEPQRDPFAPVAGGDEALRVVRGGSWNFDPGWLRSAYRSRWHRGDRDDDLGFRFSLRSTAPAGRRGTRRADTKKKP